MAYETQYAERGLNNTKKATEDETKKETTRQSRGPDGIMEEPSRNHETNRKTKDETNRETKREPEEARGNHRGTIGEP